MLKTLNTGQGTFTILDRVCWVSPLEGKAIKRLRKARHDQGLVVDLTRGSAAASLIGLDTGECLLSSISAKALQRRISKLTTTTPGRWQDSQSQTEVLDD